MSIDALLTKKFRTGSAFQLVEWNNLHASEKQILSGLYDSGDVYGLFRPVESASNLTAKVAYRETALLYLHLAHNYYLPHYFTNGANEAALQSLASLLLDGILAVESSNEFISGNKAAALIYGNWTAENFAQPSHITTLSLKAISYALLLRGFSLPSLAARLYTFHTSPLDAVVKRQFAASNSTADLLTLNLSAAVLDNLRTDWQLVDSKRKAWLSWIKKGRARGAANRPTYKIYLSPLVNHFFPVVEKSIPIITTSPAYCFKMGATVQGLLRPDKMVLYFESKEGLIETAAALQDQLKEFSPQGVPFTQQLDSKGLMSCGIDPPQTDVLDAVEAGSWRTKITDQLALSILQAQKEGLEGDDAFSFICARLLANGIDMTNWTSREAENAFS